MRASRPRESCQPGINPTYDAPCDYRPASSDSSSRLFAISRFTSGDRAATRDLSRSLALRRSSGDCAEYASRDAIWIDLSSLRSLGVMAYSDMWGCTTHGRNHRTGIAPCFGFVRGAASNVGSRHVSCVTVVSTAPARRHYDLAPIWRGSQGRATC